MSSSLPDLYSLNFNLKEKLKNIELITEKDPFLIGVCGGSASGKTSVCSEIVKQLNDKKVAIVSQDWFYRPLTEKERENIDEYNFDNPLALDTETFVNVLTGLRKGETVICPDYDFVSHSRTKKTHKVSGDVILIEGILIFHCKELRELMHMKVFVDVDDDIRLARRIIRDTSERGRTLESVINQYFKHVKPGYDDFIAPVRSIFFFFLYFFIFYFEDWIFSVFYLDLNYFFELTLFRLRIS
ncbi:uridine-cytidine kinase [Anaeramoeba flamelloides]|uniref:uridine/cytidine kinase n=1 Tax=Anaeramoeba flamelloides TaxID=1746091 RepID=A0AAV8AIJ8_9EUKA|nr:uridine-cytidine kinase [Anaeramoeba flamelloides]